VGKEKSEEKRRPGRFSLPSVQQTTFRWGFLVEVRAIKREVGQEKVSGILSQALHLTDTTQIISKSLKNEGVQTGKFRIKMELSALESHDPEKKSDKERQEKRMGNTGKKWRGLPCFVRVSS